MQWSRNTWEHNSCSAGQNIPVYFVESESSLPYTQKPNTELYPGPLIITVNPFHQVLRVMCFASISMTLRLH